MATPEKDKDGFTLVDRKRQKKRKAEHSPQLHTPPGSSSASSSRPPTRPKPSSFNFPNQVLIIFRDAEEKFKSVKQVMSELSQYHPELRVSRVKDLPNRSFLVVGNTPRDVVILQSENKMKACLGQNLKISLPKAYQNQTKSKTLVIKGVPTEFTDDEFKQVLDLNNINHAKAERMKSKRDGRKLQMFHLELSDSAEAEALISSNITCPQTGIIFKVEDFVPLFRSSSVITASISAIRPKIVRLKPSVSSVEKATHTKDAQIEKKSNLNVLIVKDHMLLITKGVQPTKNRCSDNMWRTTKKATPQF